MNKKTYNYGLEAEDIALSYLKKFSYQLLYKRYRIKNIGEVDLILFSIELKELIIVEVKGRKPKNYEQESRITPEVLSYKQRQRIYNCSEYIVAMVMNFNEERYANIKRLNDQHKIKPFDGVELIGDLRGDWSARIDMVIVVNDGVRDWIKGI